MFINIDREREEPKTAEGCSSWEDNIGEGRREQGSKKGELKERGRGVYGDDGRLIYIHALIGVAMAIKRLGHSGVSQEAKGGQKAQSRWFLLVLFLFFFLSLHRLLFLLLFLLSFLIIWVPFSSIRLSAASSKSRFCQGPRVL